MPLYSSDTEPQTSRLDFHQPGGSVYDTGNPMDFADFSRPQVCHQIENKLLQTCSLLMSRGASIEQCRQQIAIPASDAAFASGNPKLGHFIESYEAALFLIVAKKFADKLHKDIREDKLSQLLESTRHVICEFLVPERSKSMVLKIILFLEKKWMCLKLRCFGEHRR